MNSNPDSSDRRGACTDVRRSGRASHRRLPSAGILFLLAACLSLPALGCRKGVQDILQLREELAPFTRTPYLQAVDTAGAVVLWRAAASVRDSFRYRVDGDSEWRTAAVERLPPPGYAGPGAEGPPDSLADRRVVLRGLPAATRIEYTVVADTADVGPVAFHTAPSGSSTDPVRVLAFGDSGWGSESQVRLAAAMTGEDWHLAVHVGDLAYPDGTAIDFTRRHFHVYQALLARVPLFPAPGDHDLRTAGGAPYDRAFEWPAPEEGARWYTFRWGPAQFIALETGDESPAGLRLRQGRGEQLEWLRSTLDSLHRAAGPEVTIVTTHAPPYSHAVGLSGHGSDMAIRDVLAPLFDRYGVDLVLAGHDHHYERSHPIRDEDRVPPGCGPVYIVTGGGGASRYARDIAPSRLTAISSRAHHYLRLVVGPDAIEGQAIGVDGGTLDGFRVVPYPGPDALAGRTCG